MKKLMLIPILYIAMISCNKEETKIVTPETINEATLIKSWNVDSVLYELHSGNVTQYNKGVWTFANDTLYILDENNISNELAYTYSNSIIYLENDVNMIVNELTNNSLIGKVDNNTTYYLSN